MSEKGDGSSQYLFRTPGPNLGVVYAETLNMVRLLGRPKSSFALLWWSKSRYPASGQQMGLGVGQARRVEQVEGVEVRNKERVQGR